MTKLKLNVEQRDRGQYLTAAFMGFFFILLLARFSQIFDWKIIHDSAIFLYSSIQMEFFNAIPYKHLHEENPPMTYLLYYGIGKLFGFSHQGYRIFDAIFILIQMGVIYLISKSINKVFAIFPPIIFALIYLFLSPTQSLQREYLMLLPLGLSYLLMTSKRQDFLKMFLMGIAVGVMSWVKVEFSLYGVALFFLYFYYHRIPIKNNTKLIFKFGLYSFLGFLIPTAICLIYLYLNNALGDFYQLAKNYWPMYREIGNIEEFMLPPGVGFFYKIERIFWFGLEAGFAIFFPLLCLFAAMIFGKEMKSDDTVETRKLKALFLLAFASIIVPLVPMKLFLHHYFPFAYFGSIAITLVAVHKMEIRASQFKRFLTAISVLCLLIYIFKVWSNTFFYREDRVDATEKIATRLKQKGAGIGDRIQPFGWTDNGVVIPLIELQAKLPTRFIYAYQFFHHTDTKYIKGLRTEFMHEMKSNPPKYILEAPFLSYRLIGNTKTTQSINFKEYDDFRDKNYRLDYFAKNYWGNLMLYERID